MVYRTYITEKNPIDKDTEEEGKHSGEVEYWHLSIRKLVTSCQ